MSPLPANDPRRKPKPSGPARGSKRGVGYRLLPGAKTFRGTTINQDVHPFGDARMGEVGQTNVTVQEAAKRYPEFEKGFNLKTPDQYLVGLWEARKLPGLSAAEHEEFDGIPTAEEWHDMALSEDQRVIRAWAEVNQTRPFDPAEFDIGRAFAALSPEAQEAVKQLVALLGKGA